jgi:hypothetical protein
MTHSHVTRLLLLSLTAAGMLGLVGQLDDTARPVTLAAAHADATDATERLGGFDESRPHDHVVDPETGGLVSVARATGIVPGVARLGPVHADPMPPGVSLSSSTSTRALLSRASGVQAAHDDAGKLLRAGATAPLGTPGISSLTSHVAPSCSGTGRDGNRVQVLFVHEGASRLSAVAPILRNEVADVDDVFALSARQTGGERRVRWVRDGDCAPVIKDVTVPRGALGSDFFGTIAALRKLGYDAANRKYLMFADANRLCGIGTVYDDASPTGNANDGSYASYARVDSNCWSTSHSVAAHELIHTLGGVQARAPHATRYGHCYDESDLMCYDDGSGTALRTVCGPAQEQLLDCRHDDYFSTAPPAGSYLAKSWNTARSSFLDVLPPTPDVTVTGSRTTAQTGDPVTFTASSNKTVTWSWTSSSSACSLARSGARAVLVCPSSVIGPVAVTATATDVSSKATRSAAATVSLSRAALPAVTVEAPSTAAAGSTFGVRAAPVGKAPFSYTWQAASCVVHTPTAVNATVTCPTSARGRDVAVAVVVRQGDGQSRTVTRTVRLG